MASITTSGGLFSKKQVAEVFNRVAGHSAIASLCGQTPIPFAGADSYVFGMDGEAAMVGEGENKPAGDAAFKKVTVTPVKVVYQHRLTDEFVHLADEAALPYLDQFTDGFAKKIARAIDIMFMHGLNPADKKPAASLADKNFDALVTEKITFDAANADDNIQDAVNAITGLDRAVTGIAMAPAFATALGSIKDKKDSKVPLYPEFRFGRNPGDFGGMGVDVNTTVSFGDSADMAIVGDFQNALKWGFTDNVGMELIEYGDPDGQGDLKRSNQVVLRAEAYIGCGIIDPESFALIVKEAAAAA